LSSGLPSQKPSAAAVPTPSRRSVAATGALQQVHIIDGVPASPPTAAERSAPRRSSSRSSQARGTKACSAALISSAATSAFQTAGR